MEVYVLLRTDRFTEVLGSFSSLLLAMDHIPGGVWDEDGVVGIAKVDGQTWYYRIEKHILDASL